MSMIMIVKVPRGEAPQNVRKAWLGTVLPCSGKFPFSGNVGVLTGKPADNEQEWYAVPQIQALEILGAKQPAAVAWWNAHGYSKDGRAFCFYDDEAVVLEGENPQNAWG